MCMGMLSQVRAQMELVQGGQGDGQGAPVEALLRMVHRVEHIQFAICLNRCLRRRRRQTFVRTQIEEGDIYIRVKTINAKSENRFVSKY